MSRVLTAWAPAAAWAAFLFFVSSRPALPVDLDSGLDKVAHFGAYLVLGFLLAFAAVRTGRGLLLAIVLGLAYGGFDELHQSLVPNRYSSFGDWTADAAGGIAGVLLFLFIFRSRFATPDRVRGEPHNATST